MDFTRMCKVPGIPHKVALKAFRDASYWSLGFQFEEAIESVTEILIPEAGGVIWDVGGNVGMWTWSVLARQRDLTAVIVEPDDVNVDLIRMTIAAGKLKTVSLEKAALSDREGTLEFLLDGASGKTGQVATLYDADPNRTVGGSYGLSRRVQVQATTLDALRVKHGKGPDLLKIDVEGAEALVLEGGSKVLGEDKPNIVIEAFPGSDALRILREAGYKLFDLDGGNNFAAVHSSNALVVSKLEAMNLVAA